jgi:hypothetical protein
MKNNNKCWWCGGIADTREHSIKASEIRRLYNGKDFRSRLLVITDLKESGRAQIVRGSNSKALKFDYSLCATCNNTKSQPHDKAYSALTSFLSGKNIGELGEYFSVTQKDLNVDFSDVYRYICKHAGCKMMENSFEPPTNMIDFMNRSAPLRSVIIQPVFKPYSIGDNKEVIPILYNSKGSWLSFNQGDNSLNNEADLFLGWTTIESLSFRYLVSLKDNPIFVHPVSEIRIEIEKLGYSDFDLDILYSQEEGDAISNIECLPYENNESGVIGLANEMLLYGRI